MRQSSEHLSQERELREAKITRAGSRRRGTLEQVAWKEELVEEM
jgi:hypothetical protein